MTNATNGWAFSAQEIEAATGGTAFRRLSVVHFGGWSRYEATLCATRLGEPHVIVTDAERIDRDGLPEVVFQGTPDEFHAKWESVAEAGAEAEAEAV